MIRAVRFLLQIPQPAISEASAVEIAKRVCAENGWQWREPIAISEGLRRYRIMTNALCRGGNVNISIDASTGRVNSAVLSRR